MSQKVYVWDRFVRFFHWSLVLLVTFSYISGENEIESLHPYSGYMIFTLISLRVVWGMIGSQYARFSSFIYSPAETADYAKSLVTNKPKSYLGHNPLGGLMVMALLLTLFATTLSGMKLYAVEENKGPFAQLEHITLVQTVQASEGYDEGVEEDEEEEFWEEVHEACVELLIFLVLVHVLGVLLTSFWHKESLIKAMLNGFKER